MHVLYRAVNQFIVLGFNFLWKGKSYLVFQSPQLASFCQVATGHVWLFAYYRKFQTLKTELALKMLTIFKYSEVPPPPSHISFLKRFGMWNILSPNSFHVGFDFL